MKQVKVRSLPKAVRKSSRQNSRLRGMRRYSIERRPSVGFTDTPMGLVQTGTPYGMRGPDKSINWAANDDA